MPIRNLVTILLSLIVGLICYHTAQRQRYASTVGAAMSMIEERALEPRTRQELFYAAMDGMMRSLDEHSAFIDPERLPKLNEHLDQEFGGVGIVVERNPHTQELRVLTPMPNSPAAKAGVLAGDVILSIDALAVSGLEVNDLVGRIRGPRGSKVTLELRPEGSNEVREVVLERQLIPVESLAGDRRNPDGSWDYTLESHPRIAYLRLKEFGEKTIDEVDVAIAQFPADLDGLILDLRDNSGGLLQSAVDLCDRFLESGEIVKIKRRDGELDRAPYEASAGVAIPMTVPLAVLVNGNTASAAEIVAACLQDHQRAIVLGERSFGKGTVQQIIPIDGGRSALKLTVSSYWRPSGRNIHRARDGAAEEWGVSPDDGCDVPMSDRDRQLLYLYQRRREYPATLLDDVTLAAMIDPMAGELPPDPMPMGEAQQSMLDSFTDPGIQRAIEKLFPDAMPETSANENEPLIAPPASNNSLPTDVAEQE